MKTQKPKPFHFYTVTVNGTLLGDPNNKKEKPHIDKTIVKKFIDTDPRISRREAMDYYKKVMAEFSAGKLLFDGKHPYISPSYYHNIYANNPKPYTVATFQITLRWIEHVENDEENTWEYIIEGDDEDFMEGCREMEAEMYSLLYPDYKLEYLDM